MVRTLNVDFKEEETAGLPRCHASKRVHCPQMSFDRANIESCRLHYFALYLHSDRTRNWCGTIYYSMCRIPEGLIRMCRIGQRVAHLTVWCAQWQNAVAV